MLIEALSSCPPLSSSLSNSLNTKWCQGHFFSDSERCSVPSFVAALRGDLVVIVGRLVFGGAMLCAMGCLFAGANAKPNRPMEDGAVSVPQCEAHQLEGIAAAEDVASHRQFVIPALSYPAGEAPDIWGLSFTLKVNAGGRVDCQVLEKGRFGEAQTLNGPRRELLRAMSAWRYRPFQVDGKAAAVVVSESVPEQRLPVTHRPLPDVSLDRVAISLQRTGCFGSCPDYALRIHGDGTVEYKGESYVDVTGKHVYRIPPKEVALLLEDARHGDLWSMDTSYRAQVTDNPTYVLTLELGNQKHEIEDYVGQMLGMPTAISDFEDEVDRVGRAGEWIHLSMPAIAQLQKEGFDFRSSEAADMLARAVDNDEGSDEAAMLRMIELGTPLVGGSSVRPPPALTAKPDSTLVENALLHHRATLIAPLVEHGLLNTHGMLDEQKVNVAFRDAIRGGRLASVQQIWSLASGETKPSLWFEDEGEKNVRKRVPVSLLLSRPYRDMHWEGLQIAEWLASKGCDLKASAANGDTLLHRAVDAGDIAFVRYLLATGLDVSAPGQYGLPALGSAENESIALFLLQAGSDWQMNDGGAGFTRYAQQQHWGRVLAWLAQHPK